MARSIEGADVHGPVTPISGLPVNMKPDQPAIYISAGTQAGDATQSSEGQTQIHGSAKAQAPALTKPTAPVERSASPTSAGDHVTEITGDTSRRSIAGEAANWKNQVERLFHETEIVESLTDEEIALIAGSETGAHDASLVSAGEAKA
jgi:hypothetical protein